MEKFETVISDPTIEKFKTVISDPTIEKIYSFSDIHADINSLIIALRDCAKVIIKKDGFGYTAGKIDNNLTELCKIDISLSDTGYVDDLNYDWNPEASNTYVVIVGDILDGARRSGSDDPSEDAENYEPQIEIKILRFINSLMNKARVYNSRLIKLLGNHEIMNLLLSNDVYNKYIFRKDMGHTNYYRGDRRIGTFFCGKPGYNLLMENGTGIFVKINDNMFVHGQLVNSMKLDKYIAINKFLNDINPKTYDRSDYMTRLTELNTKTSPLWLRNYGDPVAIDKRIGTPSGATFCASVLDTFRSMFSGHPGTDISKLRLVIGHCIQSDSTTTPIKNKTFTSVNKSPDGITETVELPSSIGKFNTRENRIFGITMECEKEGKPDDHYIYRVDVGSSRGFDTPVEYMYLEHKGCDWANADPDNPAPEKTVDCESFGKDRSQAYYEKMIMGSRTPQVLEFSGDSLENVRIIRSTIKNTRINQPRKKLEELAAKHPVLNLDHERYRQKYLKYKNKYLQLKNKNKK
jgi:hypothetical protein